MSHAASAEELLSDLGRRMGLPALRTNAAGVCQLLFDQRWLVTLVHSGSSPCMGLQCPITAPGAQLGESGLLAMLQGSFLGAGAGGCTLCIGPDQRAYLQCFLPLPAQPEQLSRTLEQLLNHAETWAERLSHPVVPLRPTAAPQWAMQRV
jgi:hypothetical protein